MYLQRTTERMVQLEKLKQRYVKRGKEGKSRLLDEFCEHYGYERKDAIKLLGGGLAVPQRQRRSGAQRKYQPVEEVVERIWSSAEQLCGKRLAPALALGLPHYQRHYGRLLPCQKKLLNEVSPATLDRLLAQSKSRTLRGLSGTRPGTLLRRQIPIPGEVWDEKRLAKEGYNGLIQVGRGSAHPPRLIRLSYRAKKAKYHLALVGKGVTFDTGGISLKPADKMWEMKGDMSGGAAVIYAMKAIGKLKPDLNVTGIIPTAENIALVVWSLLEPHITTGRLHSVRVAESDNNYAEYRGTLLPIYP